MTFTNAEKRRLVDGDGLTDRSLFIALGTGAPGSATELTLANGYSRGESPAASNTSDANGVVTIAAGQTIYTASGNGAQDSTVMRISRAATGADDWVTDDWVSHNNIAAPVNGQSVVTGTITITP